MRMLSPNVPNPRRVPYSASPSTQQMSMKSCICSRMLLYAFLLALFQLTLWHTALHLEIEILSLSLPMCVCLSGGKQEKFVKKGKHARARAQT